MGPHRQAERRRPAPETCPAVFSRVCWSAWTRRTGSWGTRRRADWGSSTCCAPSPGPASPTGTTWRRWAAALPGRGAGPALRPCRHLHLGLPASRAGDTNVPGFSHRLRDLAPWPQGLRALDFPQASSSPVLFVCEAGATSALRQRNGASKVQPLARHPEGGGSGPWRVCAPCSQGAHSPR